MKAQPFQGCILLPSWARVITRELAPIRVGQTIIRQKPFVAAAKAANRLAKLQALRKKKK